MCVRGETATPRTPREVPASVNDSTSLKPWSMSYTLTGPSLNTYSRCSVPAARVTTSLRAESVGAEAPARLDAITDTRSVAPRSRPPSVYVEALAPEIGLQRLPVASHRLHA